MIEIRIIKKALRNQSKYLILDLQVDEKAIQDNIRISILNTETSEEMTFAVEHLTTLIHILKHLP